MATNKSKDAAALFELIDKSTLKVPKNAGALKIPSWWSSKTNPAAPSVPGQGAPVNGGGGAGGHAAGGGAGGGGRAPASGGQAGGATPAADPAAHGNGTHHGQPVTLRPEARGPTHVNGADAGSGAPTQHRLFQPPPAGEAPAVTPSIRPPARATPSPVSPGVAPGTPAESTEPAAAPKSTEAIPEAELERVPEALANKPVSLGVAGLGSPSRSPAGGSHSGALRSWPRKERSFFSQFSQVPRPAIIAACAVAVLIVLVILYVAFRSHKTGVVGGNMSSSVETPIKGPGQAAGGGLLPAVGGSGGAGAAPSGGETPQRTSGAAAANPAQGGGPPVNGTPGGATVYEPNTYHFQPDKLYVFIATDSSEANVRRNARFFAEHGISVAIERSKNYFVLIATEPLASNVAAEPFLRKIHEVAKLHWDYKSNHRVFADAVPRRVVIGSSDKDATTK